MEQENKKSEIVKSSGWAWRKWRDNFMSIGISVVVWLFWPTVVRYIDPTAGEFDSGYLQLVPFALFGIVSVITITKLIFVIMWPRQDQYLEGNGISFNKDFENLSSWERIKVTLFLQSCLWLGLILLILAI